jgi:glycosyltransferase involved in cell wall biosynthesis
MIKVSVIIPIYNVEKYISKCLDSAINQTLKDIEIICVNDCTLDDSMLIVNDYARKDSRIKIINRESNGGLSAARNTGLESSNGDFVYFLDSDDWIDLDYIESMYDAAIKNNAKIVSNLSAYNYLDGNKEDLLPTDKKIKLKNNEFSNYNDAVYGTFIGAPFKLFKKSFLKEYNLTFPVGYVYEDLYFQYLSYFYAKDIYVMSGSYYYYLIRPESIMTSDDNKKEWDIRHYKIFKHIFDYFNDNKIINDLKVKLFMDRIIFTDLTEEKFTLFKEFFKEIESLVYSNSHLYSEKELLFIELVLNETYEDYSKKYNTNFDVVVLRERIKRGKKYD